MKLQCNRELERCGFVDSKPFYHDGHYFITKFTASIIITIYTPIIYADTVNVYLISIY